MVAPVNPGTRGRSSTYKVRARGGCLFLRRDLTFDSVERNAARVKTGIAGLDDVVDGGLLEPEARERARRLEENAVFLGGVH